MITQPVQIFSRGVLIAPSIHVVAALLFLTTPDRAAFPFSWTIQTLAFLSLSTCCGIWIWTRGKTTSSYLCLFVQLVLFLLVSIPLRETMAVQTVFAIAIVVSGQPLVEGGGSAMVGSVLAVATLVANRRPLAWDMTLPPQKLHEFILFLFTVSGCIGWMTWTRRLANAEKQHRTRLEYLTRSIDRLTEANVQFQEYAATAETRSTEQERQHITRELHDIVGYALTNLIMMMEAAHDLIETDNVRLRETLSSARLQAKETLDETRRTLRTLRAIHEPRATGLKAITKLARTFENATNVRVEISGSNFPPTVDPAIDSVLYALVQEGLTNAFRHGHATSVMIRFWFDHNGVQVIIEDNGRGSNSVAEGIGIKGMRERVEGVRGRIEFSSSSAGFAIKCWIPAVAGGVL